jgi:tRNA threonylcarbamoyl adenosine modification protein YeaZ
VVILTLDTTTQAGSCAVWRRDGIVDEQVGNPEHSHAQRLPNDLARLLASHRLQLKDVSLYAIASGPGSFTGLRVGIATMQSLALVHDRLIVPISSLEALAYCGAREDPQHAQPGTYIGAWMEASRGEVFGALYRVLHAPTVIVSDDPNAGIQPEHVPVRVVPLPVVPPKTRMSLAVLEQILEPEVGTPFVMAEFWSDMLTNMRMPLGDQTGRVPHPSMMVIGDAVHAHRTMLQLRFPGAWLLDPVPIAGMIAELAAREPERGVLPHAVVPLYLRRPLAELARERAQQRQVEQEQALGIEPAPSEPTPKSPAPTHEPKQTLPEELRQKRSGNGTSNGSGGGYHKPVI